LDISPGSPFGGVKSETWLLAKTLISLQEIERELKGRARRNLDTLQPARMAHRQISNITEFRKSEAIEPRCTIQTKLGARQQREIFCKRSYGR